MKHNGERRPDEIQAEIQRTRSHMDATLTALEQRLTPGQLVDQGIDYLKHSGAKEFVVNLGDQARTNPMPVALMSVGIAWLMATGRGPRSYESQSWPYGEGGSDAGSRLSGAKESLSSAAQGAKERFGQASGTAKERMTQAKHSLSDTAQSVRDRFSSGAESARQTYQRARGGYDSMLRDHPLALGAVGLAIGAVLAAAMPRTRKEDELMGPARDRLAEQAKEKGREQLEKAKEVASQAVESVKPHESRPPQQDKPQAPPKPGIAQPVAAQPQPAVPGQSIGASSAGQPPRRGPNG